MGRDLEHTVKVRKIDPTTKNEIVLKSKHYVITDKKEIFVESRLKPNRIIVDEFWLHHCNRCFHLWTSKIEYPKTCPEKSCRSPYWNRKRIRGSSE